MLRLKPITFDMDYFTGWEAGEMNALMYRYSDNINTSIVAILVDMGKDI